MMAYAQATPVITRGPAGEYRITYTETEVAAASEASVSGVPPIGRIVSYKATKTAGSAATIAPEAGNTSGWTDSTQAEIMSGPTAAAHIHETQVIPYSAPTGTIYIRATPASATDNSVATEICILEGWG
jgi:hypothetical protein